MVDFLLYLFVCVLIITLLRSMVPSKPFETFRECDCGKVCGNCPSPVIHNPNGRGSFYRDSRIMDCGKVQRDLEKSEQIQKRTKG